MTNIIKIFESCSHRCNCIVLKWPVWINQQHGIGGDLRMKNYLPMKRVCRKLADFSTRPGVLLDRSCECLLHIISKPVWQFHWPGKRGLRQPIYGTVAWCGHRRRSHLNGLRYALTEVSNNMNIVACFFLGIDTCRCQKHPKDSKSILESVLHPVMYAVPQRSIVIWFIEIRLSWRCHTGIFWTSAAFLPLSSKYEVHRSRCMVPVRV